MPRIKMSGRRELFRSNIGFHILGAGVLLAALLTGCSFQAKSDRVNFQTGDRNQDANSHGGGTVTITDRDPN